MSYKEEFQNNNVDLQAILDIINTLPENTTNDSNYLNANEEVF